MDEISSSPPPSIPDSPPPEAPEAAAPATAPEKTEAPAGPADGFAASTEGGQRDQGDTFEAGAAPKSTEPASGKTWDPTKDKEIPEGLPSDNYSPDKPGWHQYEVKHTVAPADMKVTPDEMRDYMSRYGVPGQEPNKPITEQGQESVVRDPRVLGNDLQNGRWLVTGESDKVKSYISKDGLSISNFTQPGHALHDGRITRTATQEADGSWSVTTRGYGNNDGKFLGNNWAGEATANPYMAARINEWQGEKIFTSVDRHMAEAIRAHHTGGVAPQ